MVRISGQEVKVNVINVLKLASVWTSWYFADKCVFKHDGQGVPALNAGWSFIKQVGSLEYSPLERFPTSLCRFGCRLHTLRQALDNPVSKLFRWVMFLLCQDPDICMISFMCIFLYLLVQILRIAWNTSLKLWCWRCLWCEDRKLGVYHG